MTFQGVIRYYSRCCLCHHDPIEYDSRFVIVGRHEIYFDSAWTQNQTNPDLELFEKDPAHRLNIPNYAAEAILYHTDCMATLSQSSSAVTLNEIFDYDDAFVPSLHTYQPILQRHRIQGPVQQLLMRIADQTTQQKLPPELQSIISHWITPGAVLATAIVLAETVAIFKRLRKCLPSIGRRRTQHFGLQGLCNDSVNLFGHHYIPKTYSYTPLLCKVLARSMKGLKISLDELGIRILSIITPAGKERVLFKPSTPGRSIWHTYHEIKAKRYTLLSLWYDTVKLRWIAPAIEGDPMRLIVWDEIDHPRTLEVDSIFKSTIHSFPKAGSRSPIYFPTPIYRFQLLKLEAVTALMVNFDSTGKIVGLCNIHGTSVDKIIGSSDKVDLSVYFSLDPDVEYITDVWVRHYDNQSVYAEAPSLILRTNLDRCRWIGPCRDHPSDVQFARLTSRNRAKVESIFIDNSQFTPVVNVFGVHTGASNEQLAFAELDRDELCRRPAIRAGLGSCAFCSSARLRGFRRLTVCRKPTDYGTRTSISGMQIEYQSGASETVGQYLPNTSWPLIVDPTHTGLLFTYEVFPRRNQVVNDIASIKSDGTVPFKNCVYIDFTMGFEWWFGSGFENLIVPLQ